MTEDGVLTFSVGDTTPRLKLVLSNTIRSGDTKYCIQCSCHNQSKSQIIFLFNMGFLFVYKSQNLLILCGGGQ
jgi:hypothetical protein